MSEIYQVGFQIDASLIELLANQIHAEYQPITEQPQDTSLKTNLSIIRLITQQKELYHSNQLS